MTTLAQTASWFRQSVYRRLGLIVASWNRFWFESNAPEQLKTFRTALGILLFCFYVIRGMDLEFYFSDAGLVPLSVVHDVLPAKFQPSLLYIFTSIRALWIFHGIFLTSLLSMSCGYKPRISAAVAFVLHVSFMHRNMASTFGVDTISVFYLLYLSFADYGSVDAEKVSVQLSSVAYRLLQIQVCMIYGFSGFDKLKGTQWWGGQALWDVLANFQWARFDFTWLASYPLVLALATYMTLAWEIYFPVLIWFKPLRYPILIFGFLMHVGIGLTMIIPTFGALMITSYILFLDDSLLKTLKNIPSHLFQTKTKV